MKREKFQKMSRINNENSHGYGLIYFDIKVNSHDHIRRIFKSVFLLPKI